MSTFQYKANGHEIYLTLATLTDMKVEAIVNFFDPEYLVPNAFALEIFQKGGNALEEQFFQKWSKIWHHDFNTVVVTIGGTLNCKNVIHTPSFIHKPDTEGYFDAIKHKMHICLRQAEHERFKSIAFPVIQSQTIEEIILQSYCEALTSFNGYYPKQIYCVCANKDLFETLRKVFLNSQNCFNVRPNPAVGLQAKNSTKSPPPLAMASRETPMDVDKPDADKTDDTCPICLCDFTNKKTLDKCRHSFCSACIDHCFSTVGPCCPVCQTIYGIVIGQQPPGIMNVRRVNTSLPGFPGCGTYILDYNIPNGIQTNEHPSPGRTFYGTSRTAFLPGNNEGQTVLKMLQKAFVQKMIFTVGVSRTTNMTDTVTWNDIHHKTSQYGGPSQFGYPDPQYLKRVSLELEAKGINAKSVANERISFHLESK